MHFWNSPWTRPRPTPAPAARPVVTVDPQGHRVTDRAALHASPGFQRQLQAARALAEQMGLNRGPD